MRFSDFHKISKRLLVLGSILLVIVLILWILCLVDLSIKNQSELLYYSIIMGLVSCICVGVALCYELIHYRRQQKKDM